MNFVKFLVYPWVWLLFPTAFKGKKNIPKGRVIFICNHTSNIDGILLVLSTWRKQYFLAKKELFKNPEILNSENFLGYSAWNTSANSLGSLICAMVCELTAGSKLNKKAKERLNLTRFLDDWAYQANVRLQLSKPDIEEIGEYLKITLSKKFSSINGIGNKLFDALKGMLDKINVSYVSHILSIKIKKEGDYLTYLEAITDIISTLYEEAKK